MNQIDRLMNALADAESRIDTPPHVEESVMAAWDAAHHSGARQISAGRRSMSSPAVIALAAGLLLAITLGVYEATRTRGTMVAPSASQSRPQVSRVAEPSVAIPEAIERPTRNGSTPAASTVPPRAARAPRRALPAVSPDNGATATVLLIGEPLMTGESVRVVRMRVPRSALAAMGIRSMATARADSADVDVLVGEDGVARAVRVGM
jgi:hypothetical protein